jgi:hypothetical protein
MTDALLTFLLSEVFKFCCWVNDPPLTTLVFITLLKKMKTDPQGILSKTHCLFPKKKTGPP